jgi:hypothetical protein
MLDILDIQALPLRAHALVGKIYLEILEKHEDKTIPRRYWTDSSRPQNYTEIKALGGLRKDGGHAAIKLAREVDFGKVSLSLFLYPNWTRNGTLSETVRLLKGICELKLPSDRRLLRQQIVVGPLDLLGHPKGLLDLSMWMEQRALELSDGFPEYFEPPAETKVA